MTDVTQVPRLLSRLHALIGELNNNHDIDIHREVSQFFYMQKFAELEMLHTEMIELLEKQKRLQHLLDILYPQTFMQWQKDVRWLNLNTLNTQKSIQDLSM